MPANQPLYTFYEAGETAHAFTLADLPSERILGKPLYVLIGGSTASAAEEFAGTLRGYRIGELVGEKTAGAGFMNDLVPIDGKFVLSVSIARVMLASTGRDWEAVGISPTIPIAVPQALDAAQAHALVRLASKAPAEDRSRLEAIAEGISARLKPLSPALPLDAYAGGFGERRVRLEDGKLYYRLGDGARRLMVPLGGNVFTFEDDPSLRLQFAHSAASVTALEIARPGLPPQGRYERTQ